MPHDLSLPTEVARVPHLIGFFLNSHLIEVAPVLKQLIEELYRKDLNLLYWLELRDVHVGASSDVQEDAVNEEEEELELQVVAPGETEVEEELTQSLEFDQVRLRALLVYVLWGLPFNIDFPVLQRRFLRRVLFEVKDE